MATTTTEAANLTNGTVALELLAGALVSTTTLLDGLAGVNLSALPPPGNGTDYIVEEEPFRLPRGIWVWLVLLVPCFLGAAILVLWWRLRDDDTLPPASKHKLESQNDSYGMFNVVKPVPPWMKRSGNKKPYVFLDVGELPQQRPLGLELQELKVVRVHGSGSQWGWQVGDKIVEIAGQPVTTFEELWDRIQAERDRVPVRFMVERAEENEDPMQEAFRTADRIRAAGASAPAASVIPGPALLEAGLAKQATTLAVKQEVAELRQTANSWARGTLPGAPDSPSGLGGLPSALVGWETWAAPVESLERDPQAAQKQQQMLQRSQLAGKSGISRKELGTTRFMREIPLTTGEKLKRQMRRPIDVGTEEVKYKTDAWGRSVVVVGDQGRSILKAEDRSGEA